MRRRVLLIAYYFPPLGLSGVQRVSKFAKYLPDFDWDVTVLTVHPRSYFAYDDSLLKELEDRGIEIHRTASIDPTRVPLRRRIDLPAESGRRRLSVLSQTLFQPDNKIGWYPFAVKRGRQILREREHHAILSSAPPYTAHLIGASLSRKEQIPLIVDYRDDWLENPRHDYPSAWHRNLARRMEDSVFRRSHTTVSINERIRYRLQKRSRDMMDASRHRIITHGYDPEDFPRDTSARERGDRMRIVYTGVFYDAQKPDVFLRGLARFLRVSPGSRDRISARFVGLLPKSTGRLIGELDLSDVVHHSGYVSHADTVEEMRSADVLWMTIGRRSGSHGISTGKLYEYFGARKPILGLVPEGVARESLIDYGAAQIAEPDDPDDVAVALAKLFKQWESGLLPDPDHDFVDRFNRKVLAARLADILNKATGAA